jgi:hypothetical protein
MQYNTGNKAIELRGLRAEKSRPYGRGLNDGRKFRIIDPFSNSILDWGLTLGQGIEYCESH